MRVELLSRQTHASFVAFEILAFRGENLTDRPLYERRRFLECVVSEGERLALSRTLAGDAQMLFDLTAHQEMEGIVQKRAASRCRQGKRSQDWVKGQKPCRQRLPRLRLYPERPAYDKPCLQKGRMVYGGHVTLGVSRAAAERFPTSPLCPFEAMPPGSENAIWYQTPQPCTVTYMERTSAGGMCQPRFKEFRGGIDGRK